MSKKFEIKSCFYCPSYSQYDHDGSVYDTAMAMCGAYADGDTIKGRVFEDMQVPDFIWEECPLESYYASLVNEKPIINRRTITNAFNLKESPPRRQIYDTNLEPETVAPAPVEMINLIAFIESSYAYDTYYAPDGNTYQNHPSKVNEFMQRVGESGGNIISVKERLEGNGYAIHYLVPMGTYPITV